jgi:hypothetical protein
MISLFEVFSTIILFLIIFPPVITHVSDTWEQSKGERSLGLFERRFSVEFLKQCRIRVNEEKDITMNEPDVTKYTKLKRLSWAGHVVRVENIGTVKVFDTRPEGTRKIGRPKLRCEDSVIENINHGHGNEELNKCGYK